MAETTITNLPSASVPLSGSELMEIVQAGGSYKVSVDKVSSRAAQGVTITAEWVYDSSTTDSDPGKTKFRLNNATQVNSTFIYVDDEGKGKVDMGLLISKLEPGDMIYIQEKKDSSRALLFEVAAIPTDATGYWKIPIQNGADSGLDIENDENCAFIFQYSGGSHSVPAADPMKVLTFSLPLKGTADNTFDLAGTFRPEGLGATGDVATDWAVSNQHVYLLINSITGSGDITITGTSLPESNAVPSAGDTEILSASATGYLQTSKKWWEVINIDIPAGISAINFDYGVIGYPDMGNRNFKIIGYRADARAEGTNPDIRLIIEKVKDDGSNAMSIVTLEDIGVDADAGGDQIIDHLRTGADDRSYTPNVGTIWDDNTVLTFKNLDFDTYFTSDENHILSADGDEGFVIRLQGEPGGISSVDFIILYLYYELL